MCYGSSEFRNKSKAPVAEASDFKPRRFLRASDKKVFVTTPDDQVKWRYKSEGDEYLDLTYQYTDLAALEAGVEGGTLVEVDENGDVLNPQEQPAPANHFDGVIDLGENRNVPASENEDVTVAPEAPNGSVVAVDPDSAPARTDRLLAAQEDTGFNLNDIVQIKPTGNALSGVEVPGYIGVVVGFGRINWPAADDVLGVDTSAEPRRVILVVDGSGNVNALDPEAVNRVRRA